MTNLPPVQAITHYFHLPSSDFALPGEIKDALYAQKLLLEEYHNESKGVIFCALPDAKSVNDIVLLLESSQIGRLVVIVLWTNEAPLPYQVSCRLLQAGASEIATWNGDTIPTTRIKKRLERIQVIEHLMASPKVRDLCLGEAPTWKKALSKLIEFARFSQAPILILGESGTGKELAAKLVHEFDNRPHKEDFVVLDCSTVSPELAGSEFFGHEKGAFTNAIANRDGAFALAHLGTLFLDEAGELPLPLQAELLRVIQEGRYKRVGGNIWQKSEFRLVSATNRNLEKCITKNTFRQDLYYRIAGATIHLPALRERREDIPALARYFLTEAMRSKDVPDFDAHLLTWLLTRDYQGNIRELRQLMQRLAACYPGGGLLTLADVPEKERPTREQVCAPLEDPEVRKVLRIALENGLGLKEMKRNFSDLIFGLALELSNGNLQQAARLLQVSDRLLQGWKAEKSH